MDGKVVSLIIVVYMDISIYLGKFGSETQNGYRYLEFLFYK